MVIVFHCVMLVMQNKESTYTYIVCERKTVIRTEGYISNSATDYICDFEKSLSLFLISIYSSVKGLS